MGLINNDIFIASNGVQKAGTYISFNNETLYLRKISVNGMMPVPSMPSSDEEKKQEPLSDQYIVNANYRIFWDKAARDAGKSFLELRSVSATIRADKLTSNLYDCLYTELKKQYTNAVDEI